MKKVKVLALVLAVVMALTGWSGSAAYTAETSWAEENGIYRTDETVEELYEQAKIEGEVNVYGLSLIHI